MKSSSDFIIIGAAILDVLAHPINTVVFENDSYPAEHVVMQTGGDALNEATVLSSLNASVRFVTKVGKDSAAEYIIQHCQSRGINTDFVLTDPSIDTGINIVLIDEKGERNFITSSNGSLRKLYPSDISNKALKQGKILCFASIFVAPAFDNQQMSQLFRRAKEQNLILCADMTKRKNQETISDLRECLSYLDYIFPNYEEASLLTGLTNFDEIADAFLDCGVKHVVIKAGKKGCFIKTDTERFWVSAYQNANCIDTTGAGDTFTACFLYGLNQGMSLEECGKFANAGASICVEHIGATGAIKNIEQIWARYVLM